jgi:hypothetical protein
MLSLIKRVMRAINSFDAVLERLDEAEDRLEKLERVNGRNNLKLARRLRHRSSRDNATTYESSRRCLIEFIYST